MNRGIFGLLFATSVFSASPAMAIFNVQVMGGQRSSDFDVSGNGEDFDESGSELRFAAHLDPIPLVPVAFGVSFAQTTFDDVDFGSGSKGKVDGTDIDLEVEAWLPLDIAGLLPFAKLGYTIAGKYESSFDGVDTKINYKPSGVNLSVGVKYEFLLRLGVLAQVEFGNRKLEFDKAEGFASNLVPENDADQKSTSFLIGAQAGI